MPWASARVTTYPLSFVMAKFVIREAPAGTLLADLIAFRLSQRQPPLGFHSRVHSFVLIGKDTGMETQELIREALPFPFSGRDPSSYATCSSSSSKWNCVS